MDNELVLLDKEHIKNMFGWKSDTSIYDAMRKYDFPKQIRITPKTIRWDKKEVDAWVKRRQLEDTN